MLRNKYSLSGCIRDLSVNGDLYNLAEPDAARESSAGCNFGGVCSEGTCGAGECYTSNVDENSDRVAKCVCPPGLVGRECEIRAPWVEFHKPSSFMSFAISSAARSPSKNLETLFVLPTMSRSAVGNVAAATNDQAQPSLKFSVDGNQGTAIADFKVASSDYSLQFEHLRLNAGVPYLMQLHADPRITSISLDQTAHASRVRAPDQQAAAIVEPNQVVAGGLDSSPNGFGGCMRVLRYNDETLNLTAPFAVVDGNVQQVSPHETNLLMPDDGDFGVSASRINHLDLSLGCSYLKTCETQDVRIAHTRSWRAGDCKRAFAI